MGLIAFSVLIAADNDVKVQNDSVELADSVEPAKELAEEVELTEELAEPIEEPAELTEPGNNLMERGAWKFPLNKICKEMLENRGVKCVKLTAIRIIKDIKDIKDIKGKRYVRCRCVRK